jgi:hypothetical protein
MTQAGLQVEIERYACIDQIPPELMQGRGKTCWSGAHGLNMV